MMYPLVDELVESGDIKIITACRLLGFSPQAFHKWKQNPVSQREREEGVLMEAIRAIHFDDPEFGYRFIHDELIRQGHRVGENRVQRLCQKHQIWSSTVKKPGRPAKTPGPPVHDDQLERDFTADGPNRAWVGDITEHPTTREGKLYICVFKDLWSNRIVGYSMGPNMAARLATNALNHAALRRGPTCAGVIVHTDRGSQFRSRAFTSTLNQHHMVGSMGRVGAAGDNAAAESFFALLQRNVLNRQKWATREELAIAIAHWIETTYHRRRKQRRLGKLTPIEFETIHQTAQAAA